MEQYFNNKKEIHIFLKWKKHIIIAALLTGIAGVVISYFVKPKFESIAIVYPANVFPYSEETETEQVLQTFQSVDIRNAVIEQKNLYDHYKISKEAPLGAYFINSKWDDNISISRTPNDAIKIRVLDKDPQMARDIANSIIDEYHLFTRQLHKNKFTEVIELYSRQRERKFAMLDSLKKEIKKYNEMGIYDVSYQAKELAAAMLKGGNSAKIAEMQKTFNEHSSDYMILTAWLAGEIRGLEEFINKYDQAFNHQDRQFTHAAVISSPEVAQKRYSPVRWIYATLFTLGGFLMTLLTIGVVEAIRKEKSLPEKS
jgi:capsular polysaccharide biosynthesis protein